MMEGLKAIGSLVVSFLVGWFAVVVLIEIIRTLGG